LENSGLPNGTSVNFSIYENDPFLDDFIRTIYATVDANGKVVAEWTVTQADLDKTPNDYSQFYFIANSRTSAYLAITIATGLKCNQVISCLDYSNQNSCGADTCNVAYSSIPNDVNCNDPLINCFCSWNVSQTVCNPAFIQDNETTGLTVGTCTYLSETGDNCNDGFLTYSWIANWDGTNVTRPAECIDGSRTLECPALIQLPFFGIYNFIAAIFFIALIYIILTLRHQKNFRHKKNSRRKKSN